MLHQTQDPKKEKEFYKNFFKIAKEYQIGPRMYKILSNFLQEFSKVLAEIFNINFRFF